MNAEEFVAEVERILSEYDRDNLSPERALGAISAAHADHTEGVQV